MGTWHLWWIGAWFVVALALAVVLVRRWRPARGATEAAVSPETILLRRLSAGEIDADEYLRQLDAMRE